MSGASQPGLTLQLDFDSGQPAYLQIVRQLARQAASGRLRHGQRLPAVRRLAEDLGLNFNTVARAYRVLRGRGVISTQRGRGTFVRHKASRSAAGRRRALGDLARQYIEDARGHMFSDAEIAAALSAHLDLTRPSG
jgi:DNA-binding transcriptional regulator YhcF (GntR family)